MSWKSSLRVVASTAQDWGKNGVEMDKFYPLLDGMVSSSTHKFPSGHRFATAGVSLMGDGRISCLATAWQKTTKKISRKGMVEYHVLLVHSRSAWIFSFRFLLVEQLALVYELSCSGLP